MIWQLLITAFGSSVLTIIVGYIKNRGGIELNEYSAKLIYHRSPYLETFLLHFEIDLHFINSSGYTKIIKNIHAKFFDGNEFIELSFDGYNTSPADVVEPNKNKCLQYKLLHDGKQLSFSLFHILDSQAYLIINYIINKKEKKLIILGGEIKTEDKTGN